MKHKILGFFVILLAIIGLYNTNKIYADNWTADRVENLVDGLIAYNESLTDSDDIQKLVDNMALNPESNEWYAMALSQYKVDFDFFQYNNALNTYLDNETIKSATSRIKYALTLFAIGDTDNIYITKTIDEAIGEQGLMSLVFGLHLMNNTEYKSDYALEILNKILDAQLPDGGFAVTGNNGDVDVTAMTIQALAYYDNFDANTHTAIEKAVEFLSKRQQEDGDFKSYGVANPESTAQVLMALCSLGIDPAEDIRFIKNEKTVMDGIIKYKLDDGSFSHTLGGDTNRNSTIQAFYSFVALWRYYNKFTPFYVFDKKTEPVIEETVRDESVTEEAVINNYLEEPQVSDQQENEISATRTSHINYKPIAISIVIIIYIIIAVLLTVFRKRNTKNYLFTALVCLAAIVFILFSDIKTKEQYYNDSSADKTITGTVTIEIRCDSIIGKGKTNTAPNGVIVEKTENGIADGETCYDVLVNICKERRIPIDSKGSRGMIYISGINQLYEFDYGDLSGWMYFVNDTEPSVSCDSFKVKDGDRIEFLYTCEMGKDLEIGR